MKDVPHWIIWGIFYLFISSTFDFHETSVTSLDLEVKRTCRYLTIIKERKKSSIKDQDSWQIKCSLVGLITRRSDSPVGSVLRLHGIAMQNEGRPHWTIWGIFLFIYFFYIWFSRKISYEPWFRDKKDLPISNYYQGKEEKFYKRPGFGANLIFARRAHNPKIR